MDMDAFRAFLNQHDEPAWDEVLAELEPSLHPVDREATRMARMENILGAIHNNLKDIPELKDRIRSLVKKWNS